MTRGIKAAGDFSKVASAYRAYRPGYPKMVFDRIIELAPPGPDTRMLDLGCGTGNVSRSLANTYPSICGIDPSFQMLQQATTHRLERTTPVLWVRGFAEAIPLPASSIDLITAGQAFHWFDREAFASEALRILKPGGLVALFWEGAVERQPYRTLFHAVVDDFLLRPATTGPIFCKLPETFTREANPLSHLGFTDPLIESFYYEIKWTLPAFTGFMRSTSRAAQFNNEQWEKISGHFRKELEKRDIDGSFVEKNAVLLYTGRK